MGGQSSRWLTPDKPGLACSSNGLCPPASALMPWRPHNAKRLARETRETRQERERAAQPQEARPRQGRPSLITTGHRDPLTIFREGLALARRAGMTWQQALHPAREAALSVADERERDEWATVLYDTRTAWMRAYERRPIGCSL